MLKTSVEVKYNCSAQNDTSKTANIIDIIFSRKSWLYLAANRRNVNCCNSIILGTRYRALSHRLSVVTEVIVTVNLLCW